MVGTAIYTYSAGANIKLAKVCDSRAFEVVYVISWYLGPLEKTPGIDFTSGPPQFYLLAAAGLLLLSAYWRGRQVRV